MSEHSEALRLADAIEQLSYLTKVSNEEAANELRRLHEVNRELYRALEKTAEHIEAMMAHIEHKPAPFKQHCWQQALDARAALVKARGE